MTPAPAQTFEVLEAQAQRLMAAFTAAGYEHLSLPIVQPANAFLDVIGEELRARTYVFTDPDGAELCLRPDLTVPTCLHYLSDPSAAGDAPRYCYNGPAFRFQPQGADAAHPREFHQCGIEAFGNARKDAADAETLALTLAAVRAAGFERWQIRIGDLGLFQALLHGLGMPERWLRRLLHRSRRTEAFRAELNRLVTDPARIDPQVPRALIEALDPDRPAEAEAVVGEYLAGADIEAIGTRTVAEIAQGLLELAADANARPLAQQAAQAIEDYLAMSGPARAISGRFLEAFRVLSPDVPSATEAYDGRMRHLRAAGVDVDAMTFSAEFGRNLAYYTGFVFEVLAPSLGPVSPIAGGGRYDSLLADIGAPSRIPAVGACIHTERLLAVLRGAAP